MGNSVFAIGVAPSPIKFGSNNGNGAQMRQEKKNAKKYFKLTTSPSTKQVTTLALLKIWIDHVNSASSNVVSSSHDLSIAVSFSEFQNIVWKYIQQFQLAVLQSQLDETLVQLLTKCSDISSYNEFITCVNNNTSHNEISISFEDYIKIINRYQNELNTTRVNKKDISASLNAAEENDGKVLDIPALAATGYCNLSVACFGERHHLKITPCYVVVNGIAKKLESCRERVSNTKFVDFTIKEGASIMVYVIYKTSSTAKPYTIGIGEVNFAKGYYKQGSECSLPVIVAAFDDSNAIDNVKEVIEKMKISYSSHKAVLGNPVGQILLGNYFKDNNISKNDNNSTNTGKTSSPAQLLSYSQMEMHNICSEIITHEIAASISCKSASEIVGNTNNMLQFTTQFSSKSAEEYITSILTQCYYSWDSNKSCWKNESCNYAIFLGMVLHYVFASPYFNIQKIFVEQLYTYQWLLSQLFYLTETMNYPLSNSNDGANDATTKDTFKYVKLLHASAELMSSEIIKENNAAIHLLRNNDAFRCLIQNKLLHASSLSDEVMIRTFIALSGLLGTLVQKSIFIEDIGDSNDKIVILLAFINAASKKYHTMPSYLMACCNKLRQDIASKLGEDCYAVANARAQSLTS